MKCDHCGHDWTYIGKQKKFAKCPECGSKVKLSDPKD